MIELRRPSGDRDAEVCLHELRSALFGIEASAIAIAQHRTAIDPSEFDELANGLASEIHRVRSLVDRRAGAPAEFDLAAALGPVITCARASGMRIHATLASGTMVVGRADHAAQVVASLLDNVRHHADGSPVDISVACDDRWTCLYVEDQGPGPSTWPEHDPFERGARGDRSHGSGLGLFTARRLMSRAGGRIWLQARPCGGTCVVLAFRPGAMA